MLLPGSYAPSGSTACLLCPSSSSSSSSPPPSPRCPSLTLDLNLSAPGPSATGSEPASSQIVTSQMLPLSTPINGTFEGRNETETVVLSPIRLRARYAMSDTQLGSGPHHRDGSIEDVVEGSSPPCSYALASIALRYSYAMFGTDTAATSTRRGRARDGWRCMVGLGHCWYLPSLDPRP
eukprot:3886501-Rhodomonas_salina.2